MLQQESELTVQINFISFLAFSARKQICRFFLEASFGQCNYNFERAASILICLGVLLLRQVVVEVKVGESCVIQFQLTNLFLALDTYFWSAFHPDKLSFAVHTVS
eukprot:TRINITY_DN5146_c0_g6_i3.p14 TRINITY_DN5146_c0_g6~~TRINITY_DN5146_c0_g6_i3.p14  ORF type:complete len:105 (-),score=4.47 TRINITY_DN5146_c0_g6_i3:921-1235(-)